MKASEVKNYFNYDESNSSNPLVLKRDLCTHNKKGKRVGYNHNGYQRASLNGRKIMVHQLVWAWHTGEYTGDMVIDHIDHDRSNNLISNLRKVSQADNCRNAKLNKTNSSGLHGVSFNKGKCRWYAYGHVGKKQIPLGSSKSKFEAVCLRKSWESSRGFHDNHGKLRRLNNG